MQGLDVPVGLRATGVDAAVVDAEALEGGLEVAASELAAVIREDALEPPAGRRELRGDAASQARGLLAGGLAPGAADEVGPRIGRADVDRRQLPDRPLRALEAADEEAVHADELAGAIGLDVAL